MELQIVKQNAQITQQNQRLLALEAEQSKRRSLKAKVKTGLALAYWLNAHVVTRANVQGQLATNGILLTYDNQF